MSGTMIRRAGYLAGESALIVLSILLAFGLNEWRQERSEARNAEEALDYFRLEITNNLKLLERAIPYHQEVAQNFQKLTLEEDDPRNSLEILMGGGVMPRGIDPPLVSDSAWQTALARNALAYFEFDVTYALSGLYSMQESGVESTWRLLAGQFVNESLFDPGKSDTLIPMLGFAFQELLSQEQALAAQYKMVLKKLDPGQDP